MVRWGGIGLGIRESTLADFTSINLYFYDLGVVIHLSKKLVAPPPPPQIYQKLARVIALKGTFSYINYKFGDGSLHF